MDAAHDLDDWPLGMLALAEEVAEADVEVGLGTGKSANSWVQADILPIPA